MNEFANPLDYILKCAEQGLVPKLFTVQNAKDELKKLREQINKEEYFHIGWTKVTPSCQFYDPRFSYNIYEADKTISIYANKEELKKFLDNSRP